MYYIDSRLDTVCLMYPSLLLVNLIWQGTKMEIYINLFLSTSFVFQNYVKAWQVLLLITLGQKTAYRHHFYGIGCNDAHLSFLVMGTNFIQNIWHAYLMTRASAQSDQFFARRKVLCLSLFLNKKQILQKTIYLIMTFSLSLNVIRYKSYEMPPPPALINVRYLFFPK